MGSVEACVARGRAYSALGALFRSGPCEEDLSWIGEVGALREAVDGRSLDSLAAEHHRVTAFEVFPYEAVFWHPEGLRGGPVVEACQEHLSRLGMRVPGDTADHVGTFLGVLGLLSGAEADALADENGSEAKRMAECAAAWIDERGGWLPIVLVALQRVDSPLYGALAALAGELLVEHRGALPERSEPSEPVLPPVPDLLDDGKTGFKDITRYLTLPALTGWWISKAEIGRVGTVVSLPTGFDSRARMLENLWFTARDHEQLPELIAALDSVAEEWDAGLASFEQGSGGLARGARLWRERLAVTRGVLGKIGAAAVAAQD